MALPAWLVPLLPSLIAGGASFAGSLVNRNTAQQQAQAAGEMSEEQREYLEEQNRRELERQYNQAQAAMPYLEQLGGMDFQGLRDIGMRAEDFGMQQSQAFTQEGQAISDALMAFLPQVQASDTSGLAAQARRQSEQAGAATQAALASRGIYTSGAGIRAEQQAQSDIFGQLAAAINQDELQRTQAAIGLTQAAGTARLGAMETGATLGLRGSDIARGAVGQAGALQSDALSSVGQLISMLPGAGVTPSMFAPPPAPEPTPAPSNPSSGGGSSSSTPAPADPNKNVGKSNAEKMRDLRRRRAEKKAKEKLEAEKARNNPEAGGFQGGDPSTRPAPSPRPNDTPGYGRNPNTRPTRNTQPVNNTVRDMESVSM